MGSQTQLPAQSLREEPGPTQIHQYQGHLTLSPWVTLAAARSAKACLKCLGMLITEVRAHSLDQVRAACAATLKGVG